MRPLEVVHAQQRIGIAIVQLRVKAHVAVEKQNVDTLVFGLRKARAFGLGQRHEGDGFAGGLAWGFYFVAKAGDELSGSKYMNGSCCR